MENKNYEFEHLASSWMALYKELKKNSKINFDLFNEAFTGTYHLLAEKASESSVEKSLLGIIVNASLFAHADINNNADAKYKSALVLTERMLSTLLADTSRTSAAQSAIYIFELRQEITINFDNISESLDTLAKLYEADYWNGMGK